MSNTGNRVFIVHAFDNLEVYPIGEEHQMFTRIKELLKDDFDKLSKKRANLLLDGKFDEVFGVGGDQLLHVKFLAANAHRSVEIYFGSNGKLVK